MTNKKQINNKEVFEQLVYHDIYGDKETIEVDFLKFLKVVPANIQILVCLFSSELSKPMLEQFEFSFDFSCFNVQRQRLKKSRHIEVTKKEDKFEFLTVSKLGEVFLKDYFMKKFINTNHFIIENRKLARKSQTDSYISEENGAHREAIKSFYQLTENTPAIKHFLYNGYISYDIEEILLHSDKLGNFVLDRFEDALDLFKLVLKKQFDGEDAEIFEKYKHDIKIIGLQKLNSQKYSISHIPSSSTEFIAVQGILTRKLNKVKEEIINFHYNCSNPDCVFFKDVLTAQVTHKACMRCKSPLDLIKQEMSQVLRLEIQDLESESALQIRCYGNLTKEFDTIRVGEEITVYGHVVNIQELKIAHQRIQFERCFIVNSFHQSSNIVNLTDEDRKQIATTLENLKNDNMTIKDFLLAPFVEHFPYPQEMFDFALIPQVLNYQQGKENIIHILVIGSADTGKTTYFKTLGKMFPKIKKILLKQLSEAKFYGAVKNDGLTDIGTVMSQRDGTLILDEMDKDPDCYEKSSNMLNETLEEQTATKEKAGISIKVKDVNMRFYGVMNPDPTKQLKTLGWVTKQIHVSTLTRFFLIDFDYFVGDKEKDFIIENDARCGLARLENYDFEIRQKLILYLRSQEVDLSGILIDLINFQKAVRQITAQFEFEQASRNIKQLKNIIVALCRLKGKSFATIDELNEGKHLLQWMLKTQGQTLDTFVQNLSKENCESHNLSKSTSAYIVIKELFEKTESLTHKEIFNLCQRYNFTNKAIEFAISNLKKNQLIYEPRVKEFHRLNEVQKIV